MDHEGQYDDAEEQLQPTAIAQQEADEPVHEVFGEATHALETTYDGPYNDPVEETSEVQGELDADDVHAQADTDASTSLAPETTEYAEETLPHEEDEEEGDQVEEAAVSALDDSAPADEAEEVYEGEAEGSEETLDGDVVEGDSGAVYQDEDESSADDGGDPGHEQVEAGEQGSYSHSTNIHVC